MKTSPYCRGYRFAGIAAGIKQNGLKDLGLIYSDRPASVAGVFTRNQVQADCVRLNKERVALGTAQAVIANSGNANCFTGEQGAIDNRAMAAGMATALAIPEDHVLVASTGVIGRPLPLATIRSAMPRLIESLDESGLTAFAESILTTDTVAKTATRHLNVGDRTAAITGVAKGSGMIRPDMATMLCFVCTDIAANASLLQSLLAASVDLSFNRITVDGDTSTNDMVLMMANGMSGLDVETPGVADRFQEQLDSLLVELAKKIVKDGEGATKLIEIVVKGAKTDDDARAVADTVAHSNLVKTAFFGEDANWGRIVAAAGRAHVPIDPQKIDVCFGPVLLVKGGKYCGADAEQQATQILRTAEFEITINLNLGAGQANVWTCDFSVDYVKINANYRS